MAGRRNIVSASRGRTGAIDDAGAVLRVQLDTVAGMAKAASFLHNVS